MKHILYTVAILLMATACSNEDLEQNMKGKAKMLFCVSSEDCPVTITKATPTPEVETLTVKVTDSDGNVKVEKTLGALQQETPLYLEAEGETGTAYRVEAYSNKLEDAVLDKPCFYASNEYTLKKDETVTAELVCSLQQFQISFKPSESFMKAFRKDENVQEGQAKFQLVVSDANDRKVTYTFDDLDKSAYFDAAKASSYIKINLKATTLEGFPVDYSETIYKKDGSDLERKDHLLITLNVGTAPVSHSLNVKATNMEL